MLANNKVSLKTVQEILCHTDSKTTVRYYIHSDMDEWRTTLEAGKIGAIAALVQMANSYSGRSISALY